jgi:coenzyme F420 hydrogenase subunit beta
VTRATEDPYTPETIITGDIDDLMPDSLNSIYSPTSPMTSFKNLDHQLRYAFVGLPCHIAGLSLCPDDIWSKIHLRIGIFCSHMPSFKFVDAFIKDRAHNGPVRGIRFRGRGWPGKSYAIHANGNETETGFIDMWYAYNHERAYQLSRCGVCSYYSAEFADISIGDPWHLFGKDDIGSSLVLVRTDRGEEALKSSGKWLNIKEVDRLEYAMDFHVQHSAIKQENKARYGKTR